MDLNTSYAVPVISGQEIIILEVLHTDTDDSIKLFVKVSVIQKSYVNWKLCTPISCIFGPLFRNCDANHSNSIVFCQMLTQSAPTTPDIQYSHPWLQHQFLGNKVHFIGLSFSQVFCCFPVPTTVIHGRVKK